MHSPSLLTPAVAHEVAGDRARLARRHRDAHRKGSALFGRFRRRSGASRPLVPRGRISPPLAH